MNGQPLHYKLLGKQTFVLYSVGEDGQDNGGDAGPAKLSRKPGLWEGRDAVWTLPGESKFRAKRDITRAASMNRRGAKSNFSSVWPLHESPRPHCARTEAGRAAGKESSGLHGGPTCPARARDQQAHGVGFRSWTVDCELRTVNCGLWAVREARKILQNFE